MSLTMRVAEECAGTSLHQMSERMFEGSGNVPQEGFQNVL